MLCVLSLCTCSVLTGQPSSPDTTPVSVWILSYYHHFDDGSNPLYCYRDGGSGEMEV